MTCAATRELTVYNDRSRRSAPWIITCQQFLSISFLPFLFLSFFLFFFIIHVVQSKVIVRWRTLHSCREKLTPLRATSFAWKIKTMRRNAISAIVTKLISCKKSFTAVYIYMKLCETIAYEDIWKICCRKSFEQNYYFFSFLQSSIGGS